MTLRLHVAGPLRTDGELMSLDASAARHVQVRRLQPGDALVLFDGRGGEWSARVDAMRRDGVDVRLGSHVDVERELAHRVTLIVGVPANERMDWLVEKATELGVARIRPVLSERSVLRLPDGRAERRRAHWQAVAVAAAEQCGRTRVPAVEPVVALEAALAAATEPTGSLRWLLSPDGKPPGVVPDPGIDIVALSGPEGGLSDRELAVAGGAGFLPLSLGARILRAETAPVALLAWLGAAA